MSLMYRRYLMNSGGKQPSYADKILGVEPANLIGLWPLNELTGTTADNAEGTAARDGTYTGVTLGQSVTPFVCPLFDGVNDFVTLPHAALDTPFDGGAGTLELWVEMSAAGIWTDGAAHTFAKLTADADNYILLQKTTTNGELEFTYRAQGTSETVTKSSVSTTGLFHVAITWDKTANAVKAYYNGAQEGSTQTIAGTWAGALASAFLGAASSTPTTPHNGYLAPAGLWNKALTAAQILNLYNWGLAA
jgi:hypothetical protein